MTENSETQVRSIEPLIFNRKLSKSNNAISLDTMAIITHLVNLHNITELRSYKEEIETLKTWISNRYKEAEAFSMCSEPQIEYNLDLFKEYVPIPFKSISNPTFKFIDLFAGIGGFRIAMQDCGGKCVYSSEWDEKARQTYFHNFGDVPFGDITKEYNKQYIPNNFDVLCAGFPCQAFSIAGYRKGFDDIRGTLFFDVADIIKRKHPKAIYLENVKNLYTHDHGKTFAIIKSTLEDLGYVVYHKVMNAMEYANIPQNRERIFIVCFDPAQVPNHTNFHFPKKEFLTKRVEDCIDYSTNDKNLFYTDKFPHYEELCKEMNSTDSVYQWRRQYVRKNMSHVCPTLTANMGTGGHNVPLIVTKDGIRKLSPKECLNFQGYPNKYNFPNNIPNSAKYKQAGNSVVVPLIRKVCKNIITTISKNS